MSSAPIWMPLYIGDYLRDTARLTTEQHGAYLLLIMDYWTNGPLPDDDAALAQVARMTRDDWDKTRPAISRLFQISLGEWRHKRIDDELEKARQFFAKQKANGMKGGRPRKNPNETQTITQTITQTKPKTNPDHNPNETHGFCLGLEWVNQEHAQKMESGHVDGHHSADYPENYPENYPEMVWVKPKRNPNETQTKPKHNPDHNPNETQTKANHNHNHKYKDKGSKPPLPPLPVTAGLDVAAWERWVRYRADIRKPIKPASMQAAQEKLAGFGADQSAVVEQSIANGWQGLFELKAASPTPQRTRSIHDERAAVLAALSGSSGQQGARIIDITPSGFIGED